MPQTLTSIQEATISYPTAPHLNKLVKEITKSLSYTTVLL